MEWSTKKGSSFTKGCLAKESGMALEYSKFTIPLERGLFTSDSLLMGTNMEKGSRLTKMDSTMKESGRTTKDMGSGN
jgi:hypothetical protein